MQPFISHDTFFLLNKSDLVSLPAVVDTEMSQRAWTASLHTGDGTMEFLDGLATALQNKCVGDVYVCLP
jgi:hypothetical protein